MAIFHFSAKIIKRSDGGNAVAAAAYRAGERLVCERTGQVFNYTRKTEVSHRVILVPDNSPSWVFDRAKLWNAVEKSESRVNSQLARDIEISLPIELTPVQQIKLVEDYIQEQFINMGMIADIAIHDKPGNPHVHILLTLRDITSEGIGAKRRDWNNKALIPQWREAWATSCNAALALSGSAERIDHRSNKTRGMDALATIHLGRRTPANAETWDERAAFNAWIQTSIELAKVQAEVKRVQSQIIDLTTTIGQALAERDSHKNRPPTTTPAAAATIWTPGSELRINPASAASLLRRASASKPQPGPTTGATPSTHPATDLHSAPDFSKETKLC